MIYLSFFLSSFSTLGLDPKIPKGYINLFDNNQLLSNDHQVSNGSDMNCSDSISK